MRAILVKRKKKMKSRNQSHGDNSAILHKRYDTIMNTTRFRRAALKYHNRMKSRNKAKNELWDYFLSYPSDIKGRDFLIRDARGIYNRQLIFERVCTIITKLMYYKEKHYGTSSLYQNRWLTWLNSSSYKIEKQIYRNVQKEINWRINVEDDEEEGSRPTLKQMTTLAWENQKKVILKYIIEPYIRYKKGLIPKNIEQKIWI